MKTRTILLTLVAFFAAAVVCFAADDTYMGTWKLNEAKSKLAAGATRNHTVVYAAAGDSVKVTVDGVDSKGNAVRDEWTGKFDGMDYAVTGDPASDMRSYKRMGPHALAMTIKKGGKVTMSGTVAVSADGKSRTVTVHGTDAMGMKVSSIAVYDKQ